MNNTIYPLLNADFWTKHHCRHCCQLFTDADYQTNNYLLFFRAILTSQVVAIGLACLEQVLVELAHKYCPLFTSFSQAKHPTIKPAGNKAD